MWLESGDFLHRLLTSADMSQWGRESMGSRLNNLHLPQARGLKG